MNATRVVAYYIVLKFVPRPKTRGKRLLYMGHFDIPRSQSIQMIAKLLFHLAPISLKIEIFEKIHTKSVEILCTKNHFALMFSHFIFRT
jgi:hypothetical protein